MTPIENYLLSLKSDLINKEKELAVQATQSGYTRLEYVRESVNKLIESITDKVENAYPKNLVRPVSSDYKRIRS